MIPFVQPLFQLVDIEEGQELHRSFLYIPFITTVWAFFQLHILYNQHRIFSLCSFLYFSQHFSNRTVPYPLYLPTLLRFTIIFRPLELSWPCDYDNYQYSVLRDDCLPRGLRSVQETSRRLRLVHPTPHKPLRELSLSRSRYSQGKKHRKNNTDRMSKYGSPSCRYNHTQHR